MIEELIKVFTPNGELYAFNALFYIMLIIMSRNFLESSSGHGLEADGPLPIAFSLETTSPYKIG
ncbi:MAG: hypothetical protein V1844_08405 [Pseudomonadota bacterium]